MLPFKLTKNSLEFHLNSVPGIQSSTSEIENNLNLESKNFSKESRSNNPNNLNLMNSSEKGESSSFSRNNINIFYSKIKYMRKKYNIKKSRKNHIDSLVKKAKSKFLKAIYESLKFCLHSCKIKRLPQKFIINTRIEYNKKVLNKTVEEIYSEFKVLPTFEVLLEKHKVYKNKQDLLYSLMKSNLKDIYKYYISSDLYIMDKKRIESKFGESVVKLYDFVATNFCEYFLLNKGYDKRINQRRSNKNLKRIFVKKRSFEIQKRVTKNTDNNDNKDNKDNNINNNKNTTIKFNILKFNNDISMTNDDKKVEAFKNIN